MRSHSPRRVAAGSRAAARRGERAAAAPPVDGVEVGDRDALPHPRQPGVGRSPEGVEAAVDAHQPFNVGVAEGREEDAADEREGAGHRGDTERQTGRGGEPDQRPAGETAEGLAEILEHGRWPAVAAAWRGRPAARL